MLTQCFSECVQSVKMSSMPIMYNNNIFPPHKINERHASHLISCFWGVIPFSPNRIVSFELYFKLHHHLGTKGEPYVIRVSLLQKMCSIQINLDTCHKASRQNLSVDNCVMLEKFT